MNISISFMYSKLTFFPVSNFVILNFTHYNSTTVTSFTSLSYPNLKHSVAPFGLLSVLLPQRQILCLVLLPSMKPNCSCVDVNIFCLSSSISYNHPFKKRLQGLNGKTVISCQVKREGQLRQEEKKNRGWFSGWFSSSPSKEAADKSDKEGNIGKI